MPRRISDDERETKYVDKGDDCWLWTGALNGVGYGIFTRDYRNEYAHRWSYERYVGPVPEGMTLDHTCHDPQTCPGGKCIHRRCCNPAHLSPVTRGDNARRAVNPWVRRRGQQ